MASKDDAATIAADIAKLHAAVFGHAIGDLHKFLATLPAELGEGNADESAVDRWIES